MYTPSGPFLVCSASHDHWSSVSKPLQWWLPKLPIKGVALQTNLFGVTSLFFWSLNLVEDELEPMKITWDQDPFQPLPRNAWQTRSAGHVAVTLHHWGSSLGGSSYGTPWFSYSDMTYTWWIFHVHILNKQSVSLLGGIVVLKCIRTHIRQWFTKRSETIFLIFYGPSCSHGNP